MCCLPASARDLWISRANFVLRKVMTPVFVENVLTYAMLRKYMRGLLSYQGEQSPLELEIADRRAQLPSMSEYAAPKLRK